MTRSILLKAGSAAVALDSVNSIKTRFDEVQSVVANTSRFARLLDIHSQMVGDLLYLRLEFDTGDAAGHNMATKAADAVMEWIIANYPALEYGSISGNYCIDKKASAVNGILGRGKYVVAELLVQHDTCSRLLRTTASEVVALNLRKNLIGSTLAGSIRSANAHFANMLLAFYLATGQDAANIIEGSQGITHAEDRDGDLYFSVTIPNIIVGTVGNGKDLAFAAENLRSLGCLDESESGANSRRLAVIAAATVLCGELSLMAAQTNPGELMRAHQDLERRA
jgi:hydroxymethylglutaryl-CoA reductase (NADPH)